MINKPLCTCGELLGERHFVGDPEGDRLKFTGHQRDADLKGIDYHGARYYNPTIGRYLSIDPLQNDFSEWNAFGYTLDNPVMWVEQDGRSPILFFVLHRIYGDDPNTGLLNDLGYDSNTRKGRTADLFLGIAEIGDLESAVKGIRSGVFSFAGSVGNLFGGEAGYSDVVKIAVAPLFTGDQRAEQVERIGQGDYRAIGNLIGEVGLVGAGVVAGRGGAMTRASRRSSNTGTRAVLEIGEIIWESAEEVTTRNLKVIRTATLKESYRILVEQATEKYGGNVTVQRNGVDLFRVHQVESGHGYTVTQIRRNINPSGKAFKNADVVKVRRTHIKQLERAMRGDPRYSLRTKGGRK